MAEDLGERSEDATPKRLQQAREDGSVAKSNDASAAAMLLIATLALVAGLEPMLAAFARLIRDALDPAMNAVATQPERLEDLLRPSLRSGAIVLGIILAIAAVAAWLVHVWQIGFLLTTKPLLPKFDRLNPVTGFGRLLGKSGLIKTGFDLAKVALVGTIAYITIAGFIRKIVTLPAFEPQLAAIAIAGMLVELALKIVAALVVLGLIDYFVQHWRHREEMRMTKQQVKEEYKQSEGDPEVKRRRFQLQRQLAMQRISSAVPKADVIVTNPEHISIAIQYDAETMHAPRVVAKGADYLALRIRQIARQHGVPIVERKPLARALYKQVPVGGEVPPDFYKAVAEILAFVYRLDGAEARRAARRRPITSETQRAERPEGALQGGLAAPPLAR
ncbi:MAG: flagellar biosynthesis protein FlhB [Phycisphaerae bacterium]|jgi:flagellar biosynthetic protein FlhB|nr:flagellar biosynthesis protein FlhB [Phycisphaerae bacterium]